MWSKHKPWVALRVFEERLERAVVVDVMLGWYVTDWSIGKCDIIMLKLKGMFLVDHNHLLL